MEGKGSIVIKVRGERGEAIGDGLLAMGERREVMGEMYIDITDTGKGIDRRKFKRIFYPGYTSKKRGWGLGLSLSKRIIEDYHRGKLFVKHSQVGVGTTFRIVLRGIG